MEQTIEKLNKLHKSVQTLESALQNVWSLIEELDEDEVFRDLRKKAKQSKGKNTGENLDDLLTKFAEYEDSLEEIPEDGTAAVDLEDAISELIEWMNVNS
jgi:uncharacterized protein (UPF0147 family)